MTAPSPASAPLLAPPPGRLYGIEYLRFGAAFAVLLAHYNHFFIFGLTAENYDYTRQPLFELFEPFYHYGTRAVEVFWCISGFIFLHQYGDIIARRAITPQRFFWLRFSRLYPLHLATLLAVTVLQVAYQSQHGTPYIVALNDLKHFGLQLFFASHWGLQEGFSFNAPVWSVSLEILAYVFFFVTTWCFGAPLFMVGAWLLSCVTLNHFLGYEGVFVRCLFYFYLGALSGHAHLLCRQRPPRDHYLVGAVALALALFCLRRFRLTSDLDTWILNTATPLALLLAALLSPLVRGRAARGAELLGNLTYASYLTHFPLQLLIMLGVGFMGIRHDFAYSPWFLLTYLVVILGLSRVVYLYVELPAQNRLRRRFVPAPSHGNGT